MRAYGICACFPKQAYALLCSNYCPHEYFRPYKIIHVFLVLILTVQVLISFSPQPHISGWPQKFGNDEGLLELHCVEWNGYISVSDEVSHVALRGFNAIW